MEKLVLVVVDGSCLCLMKLSWLLCDVGGRERVGNCCERGDIYRYGAGSEAIYSLHGPFLLPVGQGVSQVGIHVAVTCTRKAHAAVSRW